MAKIFTISEGLENLGAMKTGGQGSVYKGKRVGEIITAIKILPTPIFSESAEDKNYSNFQSEVQKLKKVNETPNPNVVKILSSGVTDSGNFPFIEMEFIEGPDLEDFLEPPHDPVFSIKETLKVIDQLSHALAHCHRVEVKHGDIKSNNIKFNNQTGNYVLLDFGMAIMSDEQRRTSMRHAGAVEFMAPEQNDGLMLFQTDVYSFGVVIYEMLTGTVPFPMQERSESSRNKVMVAHMEMAPPDLIEKRRKKLPDTWSNDKKLHEMHLPEWVVSMVYKCLEKDPEHRFKDGVELCDYVTRNSIITASKKELNDERVALLQQENERLMKENEQLQERLIDSRRRSSTNTFLPANTIAEPVDEKILESDHFNYERNRKNKFLIVMAVILGICVTGYLWWNNNNNSNKTATEPVPVSEVKVNDTTSVKQTLTPELRTQLTNARTLLLSNRTAEALTIYKALAQQQIPEALYEQGNQVLLDRAEGLKCNEAFDMVTQAAGKGYTPAKRTLGLIYMFADDPKKLEEFSLQNRCNFSKNPVKGSKFLMEAMIEGDTLSARIVEELKAKAEFQSAGVQ